MSLYQTRDIEQCRKAGHHFDLIWSDKTPLKMSIVCKTCSDRDGVQTMVAFGDEAGSWGPWPERSRREPSDRESLA